MIPVFAIHRSDLVPGYSPLCVAKEANTTLVLLPEVPLSRHAEVFQWI